MRFIGITGGVGAGKSALLKYIKENFNARVMLADEIAHEVMEPGGACYNELRGLFEGMDAFDGKGSIDRLKMAQIIFKEPELRAKLNAIVHPAVKQYVIENAELERKKGDIDILILEAALLIEEKYYDICDELWFIYTSEQTRRERLKESRGYSDEKIDQIIKSQLTEETFRKYCRVEIDNNGTLESACEQIARNLQV